MKGNNTSKILLVRGWMALLIPLLSCAGMVAASEERPSPHELAAIARAEGTRHWFHELEFDRDPLLRARPEQVVVLHLEPEEKNSKRRLNTIPYEFTDTDTYNFCVPNDDPHIRSLRLYKEGSRLPLVHVSHKTPCKELRVEAGLYRLEVTHEGSAIVAEGRKAFVYVPRVRANVPLGAGKERLQGATVQGTFLACNSNAAYESAARYLFTGPSGAYIVDGGGAGVVTAPAPPQDQTASWVFCDDGSGNVNILQLGISGEPKFIYSSGPAGQDTSFKTIGVSNDNFAPTDFKFTDIGDGEFSLEANFSGNLYPVNIGADGYLRWNSGVPPAIFSVVIKLYNPGVAPGALLDGEVALFPDCNYDTGSGSAVVNANLADFSQFRILGTAVTLDNSLSSVKLGPLTVATLYADAEFIGTSLVISEDTPCLNTTPLQNNTASSLVSQRARQFIAAASECKNCYMPGIDLSNLDLSGGVFSGSTFTDGNFSNTSLAAAQLDHVNINGPKLELGGANFLLSVLRCTNLSQADLSGSTVTLAGLQPIVTTDFSCRADFTQATFNLDSFLPTQYRYFNLTNTTINGISGATLSTSSQPLDLSGVILNHSNLNGVVLDGVNLGCATGPGGNDVCSRLNDVTLTFASMKKANMVRASLQGAKLNSVNMDSANLCQAFLGESDDSQLSASLNGAFMRDVNLSAAKLTGALLNNANFYSSGTTASCTSSACAPTKKCASAVEATLNNTDFSGAYLNGADFSGDNTTPQSANFANAWLAGANFSHANLSQDIDTGQPTVFTGAYLYGANFTGANVNGADFLNAYVDTSSTSGATLYIQLDPQLHITFPGYPPVAGGRTLGCAKYTYSQKTSFPATSGSTTCPDGSDGPCSEAQWAGAREPPPDVPPPADCSSTTYDFNWAF